MKLQTLINYLDSKLFNPWPLHGLDLGELSTEWIFHPTSNIQKLSSFTNLSFAENLG